jgi:DNA-binding CsgD family transcriptional regulator
MFGLALRHLRIPCPRFIGREEELLWLQERLEEARRGRGDLVLIGGEAGIGKSRLIAELTIRAQQAEIRVLIGRCSLFEAALPYAPFIEAFRGLLANRAPSEVASTLGPYAPELVKLLPEVAHRLLGIHLHPAPSPPEEKSRLFESLYQVLRRIAVEAPLIVIVEDLHWADPASLELLHYLARRLRGDRWLLLATYRPEESGSSETLGRLRHELSRERLAQELLVKSLGAGETGALLNEVLGSLAPASQALAEWIFHSGEGNPFFTEEIVRALVESSDEHVARLDPGALAAANVAPSIREAILARLQSLSPESRAVLAAAAVLGRTFDLETLQIACALHGDAFTPPFMALLSLHLIRADRVPMQYGFRHHLIREVVLQSLPPDGRRMLHGRVAELLEGRTNPAAPPQLLAYHFNEARDRNKTARYALAAAAAAAAVYAHEEAARHYTTTLDALPDGDSPTHVETAEGLGDALFHAGQLGDAARAHVRMLAHAQALGMLGDAARAYRKIGRAQNEETPGKGFDAWEKALAILAEIDDPREEAMIREQAGKVAYILGQYERGLAESTAAIAAAERAHDPSALSRAHKSLGVNLHALGRRDAARAHMEQALMLARRADDLEAELKALNDIGALAIEDADFRRAREALEDGKNLVDKVGPIPSLLLPIRGLAKLALAEGKWDEVEVLSRDLEARLRSGDEHHWPFVFVAQLHAVVLTLRGRRDEAEALLGEARAAAETAHGRAVIGGVMARLHLQQGNPAAARSALAQALDLQGMPEATRVELLLLGADVSLRLGQPDEAGEFADAAVRLAAPLRYFDAAVARVQGLIAAQAGRLDEAITRYVAGLEKPSTEAQPYEGALLRHYLGLSYLRRGGPGDRSRARTQLREALKTFDGLGAEPDAAATREALQRLGGRARGGGVLTEREGEVLALLAEGLSNAAIAGRLFISERTAEVHVGNILSKLNVESRGQAVAWALQQSLTRTTP